MARRSVLVFPHPLLTTSTHDVTVVDDDLRRLVDDMVETMHAEPGVGLAANQVGDSRRVMVVDLSAGEKPGEVQVFLNAELLEASGTQSREEGCLSFPGIYEVIVRPQKIRFRALDLEFKPVELTAEDFFARVVCHEVDHLDGMTFLQRMSPLKRRLVLRRIEKLRRDGEWPASEAS